MNDELSEILSLLDDLINDSDASKLVIDKLKELKKVLEEPVDLSLRVDRARSILDYLDENPALPMSIRTELWNISALIESL